RGFSAVTMIDIIIAHAPGWFSLLTGAIAGLLLWAIPFTLITLNSLISWVNTDRLADVSALQRFVPMLLPWIVGTGLLGLLLAALRRLSAKTKRYVALGN